MEFMDMLAALAGVMTGVAPTDLWSSMPLKDLWLIFAATTGQIGSIWAYVLYRNAKAQARRVIYVQKGSVIPEGITAADLSALAAWRKEMRSMEKTGGIHTPRWEALASREAKMSRKIKLYDERGAL